MTDTKAGAQLEVSTLGPVDMMALEFPGNHFDGSILRNLQELVAAGTIRIIDLVVITKGPTGNVSAMELHDVAAEERQALAPLRAAIHPVITGVDVDMIADQLALNTTAALLLFENTWAAKTKQAMLDAKGRLLVFERIPHEVIQETVDEFAAEDAAAA